MICCFEVLLDLYVRKSQSADLPGCVFFRNPGARDLLLVPVGCDPTVLAKHWKGTFEAEHLDFDEAEAHAFFAENGGTFSWNEGI